MNKYLKWCLGKQWQWGSGSSLSQAVVHNITREIIQKADCIDLADTINRDLIKPIVDLNFGEQEFYPYIEFDTLEKEDKQSLADIIVKAHSVGITFSVSDARERLGLVEPVDAQDTLKTNSLLEQNTLNFDDTKAELNFEENANEHEEELDDIDVEVEKELQNYENIMKPMIDNIEKILESSSSIEDAIANIEKANLDTSKLEKSLFKSALSQYNKIFKKK